MLYIKRDSFQKLCSRCEHSNIVTGRLAQVHYIRKYMSPTHNRTVQFPLD